MALGLINYGASEAERIIVIGQPGHKIKVLPGYQREPGLLNRDNRVFA